MVGFSDFEVYLNSCQVYYLILSYWQIKLNLCYLAVGNYLMVFWVYNIIATVGLFCAGPVIFLWFLIRGSIDIHFKERLGMLPRGVMPSKGKRPRIWIHAVSVGEVKLANVIVRVLRSQKGVFSLVLSTTTSSGRETARKTMPTDTVVIYTPIDVWWCV